MDEGYIKINRKMLKWGWYSDPITKSVFLDILLNANYEDGEYRGHKVLRGEAVIGRKAMAKRLKLSEQQVRTAIKHLLESGEISTTKVTNRFTVVRVENWAKYQDRNTITNQQTNQQATNKQPTSNQQATTSKKGRREEVKKERNNNILGTARFAPPTVDEVRAYCLERGNCIDAERFVDYYEARGWELSRGRKMKSWRAAVRTWEKNDNERKTTTAGGDQQASVTDEWLEENCNPAFLGR